MHVLRRVIVILSFAPALLHPLLAAAQDGEPDAAARPIDLKLFFVKHFDRCYEQLEAEAKALREDHRDAAPVAEAHRRVLVAWADSLERKDRHQDALDRLDPVLEDGEGTGCWREAAGKAAALLTTIAGTFGEGQDAEAIARYDRALTLFRALDDRDSEREILGKLFDLRSREGLKAYRALDYDTAFDLLTKIEREFPGGVPPGEAADALRFLRESTGVLTVTTIPVSADGTPVSGARLVLTPKGTGKAAEIPVRPGFRWVVGSYSIDLRLPGAGGTVMSLPVVLGRSGTSIRIPGKVPPGMVYIPEGGGVPAFFIDRTEVPVRDYGRFERTSGAPDLPACDITFERAKAYAAFAKKQLPTQAQWIRAAFGDGRGKYPWGDQPPGGRCNIGSGRPERVDSYATNGASPFGVLNMAGNVWEWLRSGYAIGGGFRIGVLAATPDNWTRDADFLRDPKPDESLVVTPENKRKYAGYKVYSGNRKEVGLRCVIEL